MLGGELCQHRAWGQLLFHLPGPTPGPLWGSPAPPPHGHPRNFLPHSPALPWAHPPIKWGWTHRQPPSEPPPGSAHPPTPWLLPGSQACWAGREGRHHTAPHPTAPHLSPQGTLISPLHLPVASVGGGRSPCPALGLAVCAGRGPLSRAECCLSRHWIPQRGWGLHRPALPPPTRSLPRRSLCALTEQGLPLWAPGRPGPYIPDTPPGSLHPLNTEAAPERPPPPRTARPSAGSGPHGSQPLGCARHPPA